MSPSYRQGPETQGNSLPTATAPQAQAYCTWVQGIGLHQYARTETYMTMSDATTSSPALPPALRGCLTNRVLRTGWGEAAKGSLSPWDTLLPQPHQVSRSDFCLQGPHQPASSKKPSYHMPNAPNIHHQITSQLCRMSLLTGLGSPRPGLLTFLFF